MKIVVVKNATAIWEYDPSRDDNRVLGGLLQPFKHLPLKFLSFFILKFLISYLDSVIWTVHQGIPEHSDSMRISGGFEDSPSQ